MVLARDLQKALGLDVVVTPPSEELDIDEAAINRPALQLAGFWKFFGYRRPQILGRGEMMFLAQLEEQERHNTLKKFFSYDMPCVIVCRNISPTDEMVVMASARSIPIYTTPLTTDRLEVDLLNFLNSYLAPRETRHGVLVDVLGSGILITGQSGVGKSEAALELIRRGHRLVADDVVEIKRVSDTRLTGEAPELVRNLMEIRGVGIIDVSVMYGIGAVIRSKSIDMEIHLEMWQPVVFLARAEAAAADPPGPEPGRGAGGRRQQLQAETAGLQRRCGGHPPPERAASAGRLRDGCNRIREAIRWPP